MNPFWCRVDGHASDVARLPNGDLAVLTWNGVEIVNRSMASILSIRGKTRGNRVVPLVDGRVLVFEDGRSSEVHIGAQGGVLEPLASSARVVATTAGFFALSDEKLLIDERGEQRWLDLELGFIPDGFVSCHDGALVSGRYGFAVLDAAGRIVAKQPSETSDVVAFGDGLLTVRDGRLTYLRFDGSIAWTWAKDVLLAPPQIVGDRIVLGAYGAKTAWILDRDGNQLTEIALPGSLRTAAKLGDRLAFACYDARTILWGDVLLEQDGPPTLAVGLSDTELASAEADILYVWRATADGPAPPPLVHSFPIGTPIVVQGAIVTVDAPGRFALRATNTFGKPIRITPDTPFHPAATREEALAIIDQLIARTFEGEPLYEDLGAAVGMSARRVRAAVKARKFPLEPPRAIEGYDYIGMFTTSGKLTAADPCYFRKHAKGAFSLTVDIDAMQGNWHAFVRPADERVGELVVVHESGFDVEANENAGSVAVDSGLAGVFDRAGPRPSYEGIDDSDVAGLHAITSTGQGDGFYAVFTGKKALVAKVRIYYLGDSPPELDRTVRRAATETKRYVATERFEVGDTIEHKKFGPGVVIRLLPGDKIEARFGGEARTLVHGLKA